MAMITAVAVRFTILTAILGGKDSDSLQVSGQQNLLASSASAFALHLIPNFPVPSPSLTHQKHSCWSGVLSAGEQMEEHFGVTMQVGYFLSLTMMIPFICALADLKSELDMLRFLEGLTDLPQ
jgi:hypothetical protein